MRRPTVLTLLAALAIITGAFCVIRAGLMIFDGISQMVAGFGGVAGAIIGVLSLGVGVPALLAGIFVVRDTSGGIRMMQIYAVALIAYDCVWLAYSGATGGKISWMNIVMDFLIAAVTLLMIRTNPEIRNYLDSPEHPEE